MICSPRTRSAAALAAFWAIATTYYAFVISGGYFGQWITWTALYDAQAEGFRSGHLYLPEPAPAALKGLVDPLNIANQQYWRWDHSYYAGRLYIYWGLVPALLLAAVKTVFRIDRTVGDELVVFAFAVGRLVVGTLLIRALSREAHPRPPAWAVWMALFVFAFANPTLFLLARSAIYEASIAAGICFVLTGLYFGLRGMISEREPAAAGWFAAAGASFALAGGSRISLLPAAAALTALTALTAIARWRGTGVGAARLARLAGWTVGPAAAIAGTHLFVNYLRFGRWTEFGVSYQMGIPFQLGGHFLGPNLYLYLLEPLKLSCGFPFLSVEWDQARSLAPRWLPFPAGYRWSEPSAGLLIAVPFAWLLFGIIAVAIWRRARAREELEPAAPAPSWSRRWIGMALWTWVLVGTAPVLVMFSLSMRYEADFASGILLLAALAGWQLLVIPRSRAVRAALSTLFASLGVATVAAGVLLGFGGYSDLFARYNPALWLRLKSALDLCLGSR